MNTYKLNNNKKLILSIEDIAEILSISKESAKVTANRYVKQKLLIRIKRNLYTTPVKFDNLKENEFFQLANYMQVPSYISFASALSYYNIYTQQLRGVIESAALKRSKTFNVNEIEFRFILVKTIFYMGFVTENNFFIAAPEKALADAVYLSSLGKYNLDFSAIDFGKISKSEVNEYIKLTNSRTKTFWGNLCKRYRI
jgi:predicted transcriptional regulator of viral defense system